MRAPRRVLVIKLSALGDVILAGPAFERIRQAHPDAHITLLTTPAYGGLAASSPFFDAVDTGGRPRTLSGALGLIGRMRRGAFDRVYDLQGNDRTNVLFQSLRPFPPAWSGVATGCALPHRNPARMRLHTLERQAEQLRDAGIWPGAPTAPGTAPPPDIGWILAQTPVAPATALSEERPIALLVPGAAPSRPAKRWSVENYGDLASRFAQAGFAVQVIGGPGEIDIGERLAVLAPEAANLIGATDFVGVAALGARAAIAVGNDTGPMHLIAAAGAPTVVLFSSDSDPALCAPRGRVTILREPTLADLATDRVFATALELFEKSLRRGT